VGKDQISQVRGYGDQLLRVKNDPLDPSNRRISLIVQWVELPAPPGASEAKSGEVAKEQPATVAKGPASPSLPPAAATAPTPAKPGLLDGLKKMLPASKPAKK
jgi:chemotaxis protein MotB